MLILLINYDNAASIHICNSIKHTRRIISDSKYRMAFNHVIIQLMHTRKNVELLKHVKIMEAAPTCFGL